MKTLVAMLGLLAAPLGAAERWELQYFYDQGLSSLEIRDMVFPTARRGVAVGAITEGERRRGAAVLTVDGGAHWTLTSLPSPAISVFFLDDSLGWVVTEKGLYRSEEGGRSWRKAAAPKEILRVHFLDARRGFAVGLRKSVYATGDGGAHWSKVAAAQEPKANPDYTVYNWISFPTPEVGMITGWNRPPRRSDSELPAWMEPELAAHRPELPTMSLSLETRDAGKVWKPSTVSIFGRITRVRMAADGRGLGLVEFSEGFPYASDVFVLRWKTGKSARGFRHKERAVTDLALIANGPGYLAAVEVPGKLMRVPIPGRLRVLKSDDLTNWREMEVDYRANARRAVMASFDAGNLWVATDTGMILKLAQ